MVFAGSVHRIPEDQGFTNENHYQVGDVLCEPADLLISTANLG